MMIYNSLFPPGNLAQLWTATLCQIFILKSGNQWPPVATSGRCFSLFQCYNHPNGRLSMRASPEVLQGSEEWSSDPGRNPKFSLGFMYIYDIYIEWASARVPPTPLKRRGGAAGAGWIPPNASKLTRSWDSKEWQMDSPFLFLWVVVHGCSQSM